MGFLSRFLPKPKQVPIKNNMPKEKKHIKTSFLMYCHKIHDTSGDKLCPKCTALLAVGIVKMNKCPYGVTKPICDSCDRACFGASQTKEFLKIMKSASSRMMFRHPLMAFKHKLASLGTMYAKQKAANKK